MIWLQKIDENSGLHAYFLYQLLREREKWQSISHKKMPTFQEHVEFVRSKPYNAWYLIRTGEGGESIPSNTVAGAIYLSKQNEIGIAIFKRYRGKRIGKIALEQLMALHDGPFLANINPANKISREFFKNSGFKILQVTLSHD